MHSTSVIATTFLLIALSSSAIQAQQSSYPQAVVRQYISDCTSGQGAQAQSVCTCVINNMQKIYTYEDFQIINRQIARGGKAPDRLNNIIRSCKANSRAYQPNSSKSVLSRKF